MEERGAISFLRSASDSFLEIESTKDSPPSARGCELVEICELQRNKKVGEESGFGVGAKHTTDNELGQGRETTSRE